jgi:hypothetical protein
MAKMQKISVSTVQLLPADSSGCRSTILVYSFIKKHPDQAIYVESHVSADAKLGAYLLHQAPATELGLKNKIIAFISARNFCRIINERLSHEEA